MSYVLVRKLPMRCRVEISHWEHDHFPVVCPDDIHAPYLSKIFSTMLPVKQLVYVQALGLV